VSEQKPFSTCVMARTIAENGHGGQAMEN